MKLGLSLDDTIRLSGSMHLFPDPHILTGDALYFDFDPAGIKKYLDLLTPRTANYMLFTHDTGRKGTDFSTEKLYDTEYLVQGRYCTLRRNKLSSILTTK